VVLFKSRRQHLRPHHLDAARSCCTPNGGPCRHFNSGRRPKHEDVVFIIGLHRHQDGKSLSGVTWVHGVLDISCGASGNFYPLFGCSVRATPHVMATRGDCARRTWLCLSSGIRKCLVFYCICNCKCDYQIPTHSPSADWSLRTDNHDVSRVTSAVRARAPWRRYLPRSCFTVTSSVATAPCEAALSPRLWPRRCRSFSGRL